VCITVFDESNDFRLEGERGQYNVYRDGKLLGDFKLQIPGRHNALNACAALVAGLEAGFAFATCSRGLAQFEGVDRRFQHKGVVGGVDVYDDYGHHPTEVRAVLQAFREKYPERRLITVFQPHRYSRTQICWNDFTECFDGTDLLYVCDIYAAGEKPIDGISTERLCSEIKGVKAQHLKGSANENGSDERAATLKSVLKSGDIVVTLGAGDVWKLGMKLLK
jgi:UDP-N-acetylmuramate--alanine ligase